MDNVLRIVLRGTFSFRINVGRRIASPLLDQLNVKHLLFLKSFMEKITLERIRAIYQLYFLVWNRFIHILEKADQFLQKVNIKSASQNDQTFSI